ncbi:MAG: sugar transferase [Desulfobacteraceae bacterium]|jgi:exopolysaccharide biosynthesis polyprenyl glycosylphosphotransferase|nr:sugar transferase [Desulfobacteraceae bacterium]
MYSSIIQITITILDIFLVLFAFGLAYLIGIQRQGFEGIEKYLWLLYFSIPFIVFCLFRRGMLTGYRYRRKGEIFFNTLFSLIQAGILSSAVLYLFKAEYYSRLFFGVYFAMAAVFVVAEKMVVKSLYDWALKKGFYNIQAFLIGWGKRAQRIADVFSEAPQYGVRVISVIDPRETDMASIVRTIQKNKIHEIFIAIPRGEYYHNHIDAIIRQIEPFGIPLKTVFNFEDIVDMHAKRNCKVGDEEALLLVHHGLNNDQIIIKRVFDVLGATVGLILSSILFIPIAFAIKLNSTGPVFFAHRRIGKNARAFHLYKFRTMYADAPKRLEEIMANDPQAKQEWEKNFKLKNDPRITRVGNFLRKTSLDELPQFWNVLKGDMSLVGARPIVQKEVSNYYKDRAGVYCSLKPGITGPWQAGKRSEIEDYSERVELDRWYVKHYSLWLDVKIIFKTIPSVLTRKGAV